ncbi:type II toxin-antitoxin system RelE/ParE family toxin [Streptomyces sp. MUM 178J]|uniref:type II toxin-antitoxin system RelE/ParE family toxin n=1 Tax=Streptomyces sp. MUM 178J TaxID=2791991 RepID=UPI001F039141|nr:type II toxin-antitoxin system RelE/ParE family toxin [Streptomyces sp. MUM 178J]WRQ83491.1 type II toxin-antitoxin system RelE/ParE family toxin [Streptomyces sp. MUM 178J]
MGGLFAVEIEPEIREWLETLDSHAYKRVEEAVSLLVEMPTTLGEPWSRHLSGPVRELRFTLGGGVMRMTYWLAPGRRVILLTVFRKTRMRESAQVHRAVLAQKVCEAEHEIAAHEYVREA